jgi:Coenzyme PQQ synthesis protein D (PqqD)
MTDVFSMNITISADVLVQEFSGEAVLLDLAKESYFGLDEVGTRAWRLLEEHGRLQPVVQTLLTEYEVDEDTLRLDLEELVGGFVEAGLVTFKADAVATSD